MLTVAISAHGDGGSSAWGGDKAEEWICGSRFDRDGSVQTLGALYELSDVCWVSLCSWRDDLSIRGFTLRLLLQCL